MPSQWVFFPANPWKEKLSQTRWYRLGFHRTELRDQGTKKESLGSASEAKFEEYQAGEGSQWRGGHWCYEIEAGRAEPGSTKPRAWEAGGTLRPVKEQTDRGSTKLQRQEMMHSILTKALQPLRTV